MFYTLFVVSAVIRSLIYALNFMLLTRAFLSWFPEALNCAFGSFVYTVTEPLLSFARGIIYKFEFFRRLPVDLSIFFSYLVLNILLLFL